MIVLDLEQGSQEWRDARLEKISGTRIADAIGTPVKQEALINELIAELLTGEAKEIFASQAMRLGTEAEDFAVDEYEREYGFVTDRVGLCVSGEFDWLVSSPDRLVLDKDKKYSHAVEVKSPNPETAVKYIRANTIPKEYISQVYGYFLVNEDLQTLDFVVYSPKIQNQYRLWVKRVNRYDLPLDEIKYKLIDFRAKWVNALKKLNLAV